MYDFAVRNLTIFFKDKTAVFLSFLAELIIIGLYVLFIRDGLLKGFSGMDDSPMLLDVWITAGVLSVASVTSTMGAYSVMVDDYVKKISLDFVTSPLGGGTLLGGYMAGAAVIGLFMSAFVFVLAEVYIYCRYGILLGKGHLPGLAGVMLLSSLSNSAMILLPVSFLKSSNALAACCTVLGTLIGFLTGIYLPMGSLPEEVRIVVECFPPSHSAVLYRQVLLEPEMLESFGGYTENAAEFAEYMGIRYPAFGGYLTGAASVVMLTTAALLFLLLAVIKAGNSRR